MPVFNCERFVEQAIVSALEQDYPADRLEVIVVDDGSTDATPEILARVARSANGRVRVVRQRNAGNVAAVSRAAADAGGDLLALLDADDAWPPEKTRRQVELLGTRPEVGLVYGDMVVVDENDAVIQESWLEGDTPPTGRCAARLLAGNPATASSVMFRADLRDQLFPVPDGMAFADWWLAVRVAELMEVAYLPEPRTLYRFHGGNMTLGTTGDARLRELRKALAFQRCFLRTITAAAGGPHDIAEGYGTFATFAQDALDLGLPRDAVVGTTEADRAAARAGVDTASTLLALGQPEEALIDYVRAAAADPWLEPAREGLIAALAASPAGADVSGQTPLAQARPFVVLAFAEEFIDDPELPRTYAEAMRGARHVTLAIDASELDPEVAVERLAPVLHGARLADDADLDVLALVGPLDVVGRARLAAGASAVYTRNAARGPARPRFGPDDLSGLRDLCFGPSACATLPSE